MRVVLARRRDGVSADGGPPEVHAYRVPDDDGSPAVWRAPCGDVVKPDEVEIVAASTGNPCPRCLILAALASDAPPVGRTELEGPLAPQPPEVLPADVVIEPAVVPLMYAPSWREQVFHFAEPGAERRPYQGGTVVVGLCGGIGWGPHEHAPNDWPMCAECIQIAGGGREPRPSAPRKPARLGRHGARRPGRADEASLRRVVRRASDTTAAACGRSGRAPAHSRVCPGHPRTAR